MQTTLLIWCYCSIDNIINGVLGWKSLETKVHDLLPVTVDKRIVPFDDSHAEHFRSFGVAEKIEDDWRQCNATVSLGYHER